MRLIQLMGDNVEELWEFPSTVEDSEIEFWYEDFNKRETEFDSFEIYMEEVNPSIECMRRFVDNIYV